VVKVAVMLPASTEDAGELLADARALEAAGAAMIGLEGDGPDRSAMLGAIAVVTERVILRLSADDPEVTLRRLSGGRVVVDLPQGEAWVSIQVPPDRQAWAATLRDHETSGATGVVVRWDPRLIDLLRNPEPDDRSDLLMSTG
jgi:hypothetical protein